MTTPDKEWTEKVVEVLSEEFNLSDEGETKLRKALSQIEQRAIQRTIQMVREETLKMIEKSDYLMRTKAFNDVLNFSSLQQPNQ